MVLRIEPRGPDRTNGTEDSGDVGDVGLKGLFAKRKDDKDVTVSTVPIAANGAIVLTLAPVLDVPKGEFDVEAASLWSAQMTDGLTSEQNESLKKCIDCDFETSKKRLEENRKKQEEIQKQELASKSLEKDQKVNGWVNVAMGLLGSAAGVFAVVLTGGAAMPVLIMCGIGCVQACCDCATMACAEEDVKVGNAWGDGDEALDLSLPGLIHRVFDELEAGGVIVVVRKEDDKFVDHNGKPIADPSGADAPLGVISEDEEKQWEAGLTYTVTGALLVGGLLSGRAISSSNSVRGVGNFARQASTAAQVANVMSIAADFAGAGTMARGADMKVQQAELSYHVSYLTAEVNRTEGEESVADVERDRMVGKMRKMSDLLRQAMVGTGQRIHTMSSVTDQITYNYEH